jgi:multiple sugar transport system permease protein
MAQTKRRRSEFGAPAGATLVAAHIALVVISLLFVLPFLWMLSTALKPASETMVSPPQWIPSKFLWGNFPEAVYYGSKELGYIPFLVYGLNTLIITVLCVTGSVISNALVGYSFARLNWKGKDLFFSITLATMMVPFAVTMVPSFALFKWLGWVGTFQPLWVPSFFGGAFSIFLLRQFFRTIPMDLSEAAKIDGASEFQIFSDVILPLAKPALSVVALFTFMGAWNDFMGPLIYLVDQKSFTLAVGLQAFQSQHGGTSWNLLMAASIIVIAPIVIVFFFAQKVFLEGIATTGLK